MTVLHLTLRNLRMFFRDRMAVFFSLLSALIIIGLYILFLGDMIVKGMAGMGGGVRFLIDSWIMAGLLAATSMTSTLGALGIMVDDKAKKIDKDFLASPLKRSTLAAGYMLASVIIGLVICLLVFILAEIYILVYGGHLLSLFAMLKTMGIVVLSVLASSSMMFLMVSFLKTTNAFGTASTIIGTLIGFLTGIYIPIGNLPAGVQTIIRVFPISHAGALLRQVMMQAPLADVFSGAPAGAMKSFNLEMGVVFKFGETTVSPLVSVLILVATTVVFYALAILRLSIKKR